MAAFKIDFDCFENYYSADRTVASDRVPCTILVTLIIGSVQALLIFVRGLPGWLPR